MNTNERCPCLKHDNCDPAVCFQAAAREFFRSFDPSKVEWKDISKEVNAALKASKND